MSSWCSGDHKTDRNVIEYPRSKTGVSLTTKWRRPPRAEALPSFADRTGTRIPSRHETHGRAPRIGRPDLLPAARERRDRLLPRPGDSLHVRAAREAPEARRRHGGRQGGPALRRRSPEGPTARVRGARGGHARPGRSRPRGFEQRAPGGGIRRLRVPLDGGDAPRARRAATHLQRPRQARGCLDVARRAATARALDPDPLELASEARKLLRGHATKG